MRFATFTMSDDPRERVGVCTPDGTSLIDLAQVSDDAGRPRWGDIVSLIAAAADGLPAWLRTLASDSSARALPLAEVRLLAPIPRPRKNIFCVGLNYREHIAEGEFAGEAGASHPVFPEFFTKAPTCVVAHLDPVPRHAGVTGQLDYEGELGVVIGRGGKNIPAGRALEHVFGYTIVNDVTARDLQHSHKQWFKGKSLDGSCPLGPVIVTSDEIPDPSRLRLTTTVNGERRQDASLSQMIFGVAEIIAHLSKGMTLEPGDVIATGTPSGVGYARKPPGLLEVGDEVAVAIDGIGELRNRIG
jgi:2-keto-4-pentenoate hydratase/2-oxohepta-3-ene-1,7-dioic acid hydratase in catechol pathway